MPLTGYLVDVSGTIFLPSSNYALVYSNTFSLCFREQFAGDSENVMTTLINGNTALTYSARLIKGVYSAELRAGGNGGMNDYIMLGNVYASMSRSNLNFTVNRAPFKQSVIRFTLGGNNIPSTYSKFEVIMLDMSKLTDKNAWDKIRGGQTMFDGTTHDMYTYMREGTHTMHFLPKYGCAQWYFKPETHTLTIQPGHTNTINLLPETTLYTVQFSIKDMYGAGVNSGFKFYRKDNPYIKVYSPKDDLKDSWDYQSMGIVGSADGALVFNNIPAGTWVLTARAQTINNVKYGVLMREYTVNGDISNAIVLPRECLVTGTIPNFANISKHALAVFVDVHNVNNSMLKEGEPQFPMVKVRHDGTFTIPTLSADLPWDVQVFDWTYGGQVIYSARGISLSGLTSLDISHLLKPAVDVKAGTWTMFAVPYHLPASLVDPQSFFSVSTASADIVPIYHWNHAILDYVTPTNFQPGKSYWIKSADTRLVTLPESAVPVSFAQPFTLELNAGWNMVSSPYDFPFEKGMTKVKTGTTVITLDEAVAAGQLDRNFWLYNGSSYVMSPNQLSWKGFWWWAETALTLEIEPVFDFYFNPVQQGGYVVILPAATQAIQGSSDGFLCNLTATIEGVTDTKTHFGTLKYANDERDGNDENAPPVFKEYVSAAFPNGKYVFSTDIKAPIRKIKEWPLVVQSDLGAKPLTIGFNAVVDPGLYSYFIMDIRSGVAQPLTAGVKYNYTAADNETVFKIYAVEKGYEGLVTGSFGINGHYAYPNPAAQGTTIRAEMKNLHGSGALVKIFDLSGKLVISGRMEQADSLIYEYRWDLSLDGKPVSPGIYIYKIEAIAFGSDTVQTISGRIAVLR